MGNITTMKELVSKEEWAIIYAKLSGKKVELVDNDVFAVQRMGYERRVPTKPMSMKTRNNINRTLDMFSNEGHEEYLRKNKGRLKHEKMIAEKNKKNKA